MNNLNADLTDSEFGQQLQQVPSEVTNIYPDQQHRPYHTIHRGRVGSTRADVQLALEAVLELPTENKQAENTPEKKEVTGEEEDNNQKVRETRWDAMYADFQTFEQQFMEETF